VIKLSKLPSENSALIHQINKALNAKITADIATHAAIGGAHGSYGYEQVMLKGDDIGTQWATVNAVNEWVMASFQVHAAVDASADLLFTFTHRCSSADATVAFRKYIGANALGETYSHNIHNGTAFNLDSTVANDIYQTSFTLDAADITANDETHVYMRLNEAARTVDIFNCVVRYTLA
jgi:hypothetical protein